MEAMPTDSIREKLDNFETVIPGKPLEVYQFCKYLGGRLHKELKPRGFQIMIDLALYDLREGINSFTEDKIFNPIAIKKEKEECLKTIRKHLSGIIVNSCPEKFARETMNYLL